MGGNRLGEAFQAQFADRFGLHVLLDRAEGALADDDLARPRLVAKPRRQVDDAADGGVFTTLLEAYLPERGVTRGNADTESERVAPAPPLL